MKSVGLLLLHFFTWRTLITGSACLGLMPHLWINFMVLLVLETALLLLAAVFRRAARARFCRVDWQALKFAISKRALAAS